MRTIPANIQTMLSQGVTTIATCWRLTRTDGTTYRFTDHDADINFGGETYLASSGYAPSNVRNQNDMSADTLDIVGLLDNTLITFEDMQAGLFDGAAIEIFIVDHSRDNSTTAEGVELLQGWLSEVKIQNGQYTAEIRPVSTLLNSMIGEAFSPSCRASFCDERCAGPRSYGAPLDINHYLIAGAKVTSVIDGRTIALDKVIATKLFDFGKVFFTSGDNKGQTIDIQSTVAGGIGANQIVLALPPEYDIAVDDELTIYQGCDKTLSYCHSFLNEENFRGEPWIPGMDTLTDIGGR